MTMNKTMNWNKTYCCDAITAMDDLLNLGGVDIILTSIPFKEEDVEGDYWEMVDSFMAKAKQVTKYFIIIFQSSTKLWDMCQRYEKPGRILIWAKPIMLYSYKYEPIFVYNGIEPPFNLRSVKGLWSDLFPFTPINKNKVHPYQNPNNLYVAILKMFKKIIGEFNVCDPFMGSGTTARACKNLGLNYIGFEIDPKRTDISNNIKIHTLKSYS